MRSMTGFGQGTATDAGYQVTVEITAVNSRKQVEMRVALPRELSALETQLRQQIQQRLSRGTLNVVVSYAMPPSAHTAVKHVDIELGKVVSEELRQLAQQAGLQGEAAQPKLSDLLMVPGVICATGNSPYEPLKPLALQALEQALQALNDDRLREGQKLQADLQKRGELMAQYVEAIAARGDEAVRQQHIRLQERLATLGLELDLNDERLLKELAFYAERADITEELVRLRSHLQQYASLLSSDGEPGRALEFLGQEMNREANTLASKTADLEISRVTLALKTELGRVREQIMNIE
ncbi:MAG: YicC family protein [Victivallales bacterium]|nr:YicC family protein [Victivallales bacterium]